MTARYIFLALIFITFSNHTSAQRKFIEGYYITNADDTIRTELNRISPWELRVKGEGKIPFDSYKSYYLIEDGRKFVMDEITLNARGRKERVALEVLMEGEPALYHYKGRLYAGITAGPKYYLSKKKSLVNIDETLYENNINSYIGTLGFLMKECDMPSKLENVPFSRESITNAYLEYYKCSDSNYEKYGQFIPKIVFGIGPAVALTSQTKSLNVERRLWGEVSLTTQQTLSYGFTALMKVPRLTNNFGVEVGYQQLRSEYEGQKMVEDYTLFIDYEMSESTRESYFNLGLRYQMPMIVSPYVSLNLVLGSIKSEGVSYSAEAIREDFHTNDVVRVPIEPGSVDVGYEDIFPGTAISGGIEIYTERVRPYLEYRYTSFSNIRGNADINQNTSIQQSNILLGARLFL